MSQCIPWFVHGTVLPMVISDEVMSVKRDVCTHHVGRDRSVDISKAYNHSQGDAPLIGSFDIVRYPGDNICNTGVDPTRRQVDCEI